MSRKKIPAAHKKRLRQKRKEAQRKRKVREIRRIEEGKKLKRKIRILQGKPKILAIADVEGWTGWRKMHETIKHLSGDFDIDITTVADMQKTYRLLENQYEKQYDIVRAMRIHDKYDLLYFYAHTSLQFEWTKDLLRMTHLEGGKIVAIVTQKVILKPHWGRVVGDRVHRFKEMSKYVDAYMINNLPVRPDLKKIWKGPIHYVPEGIDLDLFKSRKYNTTGKFVAAYAGKPVKEKGLEDIIRPACKKAGVKLITNTNNFKTAVPYEKMVDFYNRANVYMVASLIDGGPNPALEAAACGRPIISNKIGNMPELIEHDVNGYLINRGIDHYVKKLNELKKNPEKAKKMGEMARKAMEREWSWEYVLNTYEKPALWRVLKR